MRGYVRAPAFRARRARRALPCAGGGGGCGGRVRPFLAGIAAGMVNGRHAGGIEVALATTELE